jgi:PKD repeat protein
MRRSLVGIFITAILGVSILGCNSNSSAISPELSYPNDPQTSQNGENPALSNMAEAAASPHQILSLSQVYFNPADETFELVPFRLPELHLNILKWLDEAPCADCIKITSLQNLGGGVFNIDFQISNPFTHLAYTAFDTRGIVLFNGSRTFPSSGLTTPDSALGDGELLNADGYTALYNSTTIGDGLGGTQGYQERSFSTHDLPDALLNGFKRFNSPDPSNTRNALLIGDPASATFKIDLPDTVVSFGFAVDVSWTVAATFPVTNPITQFGPDANCPEAWKLDVVETPVGDGLTECGGEVLITIDVYDWQAKDDVHQLLIECPELFDSTITALFLQDGIGYTRYQASISNSNNAPIGSYKVLISKTSSENTSAIPWLDLTAYQIITADVVQSIKQPPVAVAHSSLSTLFLNQPADFDASDSVDYDCGGQQIVNYEWDWENNGTFDDTGMAVAHSWPSVGIYFVQLRVTDDENATDTLDSPLEITITDEKVPPVAIAQADPIPQTSEMPVSFTSTGSYDPDGGSLALYQWDWDDDGLFDATGPTTEHTWNTPGTYPVQLQVTDDDGATDTLDEPLLIVIEAPKVPPVAIAQANPNPQSSGSPVHFTTIGSIDPDGGNLTLFEWDWDNNGVFDETGPSADHSWNTPGNYPVQLRVTDDESATNILGEPLQIVIVAAKVQPIAMAQANPNPQSSGSPVNFTSTGSNDPDGGSLTLYEWDWDNNGVYDANGPSVSHTWNTSGTYPVQLRVTDDEGATDTLNAPLQIVIETEKVPPVAMAQANPNPQTAGLAVHFTSTGANDPDGGSLTLFEWDWDNDGVYDATGPSADHTWNTAGTYPVQLRVTDDENATDTLDSALQIIVGTAKVPPIAAASANPNPQTAGSPVHFSDNGSYDPDGGSITLYEWDWNNDGVYDNTGASIDHTWASAGVYTVQFRVTDDESATDTLDTPFQITINVQKVPPVAAASANPNPQNDGSAVHFSGAASNDPDGGSIVSYEWDWNNDGIYEGSGAEIDHTFSGSGVYSVQLRVTDDEAATDTLNTPLQVTINSTQVTWNSTIGSMLASNCAPCHISSSSGGKNYSTYQNFVNSNVVDLTNPTNSKVYKKIKNHSHYGDLTDAQLAILLQWITAGIPEN